MDKRSKEINEHVSHGLSEIDPQRTVEISLSDLVFLYRTFEEFNRFFHQPAHYSTLEDIKTYLGNKDVGAYSIIHTNYYKILTKYLPDDIREKLYEEKPPFDNPKAPYYFEPYDEKQKTSAIELLTEKAEALTAEIKSEKGASNELISLKTQILNAISNLEFCQKHSISVHDTSVVKIPEKGSDSYFTEFYLVDEAAIKGVSEWGIVKNETGPVVLSCTDIIIQKKG